MNTRDQKLIDAPCWRSTLETIQHRWKLPNELFESACICVEASGVIANSDKLAWSQVQPKLLRGWIDESVLLAECLNALRQWPTDGIQNCKQRLAQPIQEWNPPP
ncbi:MAG: hypothetical protein ACK55I_06845, partial [bacterium]